MSKQLVVIALGGNAILQPGQKGTFEEQYENVKTTCAQLAKMVLSDNYKIVVTHGNGPQVGNLLLQNDIAKDTIPPMPLDVCGAQSQGFIGYMIQQALHNHFVDAGRADIPVATVVTQVIVDQHDPAFQNPTKPVGAFYSEAKAKQLEAEKGFVMKEDAGRGWRRVVPSPQPLDIYEKEVVKHLLSARNVVITSGGGGIPVMEQNQKLIGIEAVIDKDRSGEILAECVDADVLLILTDVDCVKINYGKPDEQNLSQVNVSQANQYADEGHFAAGSMGPKVEACIRFAEQGKRAVIASLNEAFEALEGKAGTTFLPD